MNLLLILAAVKGISVLVSPEARTSRAAMKGNYWKLNNLVSTQQGGKTGIETNSSHMEMTCLRWEEETNMFSQVLSLFHCRWENREGKFVRKKDKQLFTASAQRRVNVWRDTEEGIV